MNSNLGHYATISRASQRVEGIKTKMDQSSAYILGSGLTRADSLKSSSRPSRYDTLKREYTSPTSFSNGVGNVSINSTTKYDVGRSRARERDYSTDYSAKPRRSTSMDYSAPIKPRMRDASADYSATPKMRIRDRSRDYSVNGMDKISSRPSTVMIDTKLYSDYETRPLKEVKIQNSTDSYLTMQKYSDAGATKDIDNILEGERRSKAYSKIVDQSSSYQQELDATRATMSDIYMNTNGFSAKTVAAITKEVVYKEDKGKKNYSWRKDMESYEDTLEQMQAHKQNVRKATESTRDVTTFKNTDSKIRNYERESRRNTDHDTKQITIEIQPYKPKERTPALDSYKPVQIPSYKPPETKTYNNYEKENDAPVKKGSWRKDIAKYEEDLEIKKVQKDNQRKIQSYETTPKDETPSFTPRTVKIEIEKPNIKSRTVNIEVETSNKYSSKSANIPNTSIDTTTTWKKPTSYAKADDAISDTKSQYGKNIDVQKSVETKQSTNWDKKTETTSKIEKSKELEIKPTPKKYDLTSSTKPVHVEPAAVETETTPKWKKPEAKKEEEPKIVENKPAPKWGKKPESEPTEVSKTSDTKPSPKWKKKAEVKPEETKSSPAPVKKVEESKPVATKVEVEETKPTPKWKKSETTPKEEDKPAPAKVEEAKSTPKWKKPETAKKEEAKVEEAKPTPKWKKPETTKKEEPKVEEAKPTPKWKKPESTKKEEPKVEEAKPTPKWKKPDTTKKEETKVEETKPAPKWKKPEATKKEEPKVEESKPAPKWKKPETTKKEEPKVEEAKPALKWKKPDTTKKEEPKVEEPKPTPKWKKPETAKKEEPKPVETKPTPKWGKKAEPAKVEESKPAETKATPKWKKPEATKKETIETEDKSATKPEPAKVEETKPQNVEKPKEEAPKAEVKDENKSDEPKKEESSENNGEEKPQEEEEEEDEHGVKAMRKEMGSKFESMDAEFEAGRSKLAALRAKIRKAREAAKASAEADALADAAADAARAERMAALKLKQEQKG